MYSLRRVLRSHKMRLLSLDNVLGVGIGHKNVRGENTGKKAIVVIVEKKLPVDDLRRGHVVPPLLDDVETDVIETGEFRLLSVGRTQRFRPAAPGVSIGHYKITAGTFGAVVRDNVSGDLVLLSNNHVLANATNGRDNRSKPGDPVLQPGVQDNGRLNNDIIAELERFVPVHPIFEDSKCPIAQGAALGATGLLKIFFGDYRINIQKEIWAENIVDAAIARPLSSDSVITSILELGDISGTGEAEIGQIVRKSGRTTGLTKGRVTVVDVTIRVTMGSGSQALFTDQVMTDMLSMPGDSGSLVLNEDNQAVGLLFAGSNTMTLFNRFSNVMKLLDISLEASG